MTATVSPHQVADLSDDDVLSQAFLAPDGIFASATLKSKRRAKRVSLHRRGVGC